MTVIIRSFTQNIVLSYEEFNDFYVQVLTPYMQSTMENTHLPTSLVGFIGGDRKQGNSSVNLWTMAFHDAFTRLCPLRAGGSKCGCLPALAKLVNFLCSLKFKTCCSLKLAWITPYQRKCANAPWNINKLSDVPVP